MDWRAALTGDKARFIVLCFFTAAVFLMGGASRADVVSLVILRPLAIFVAAYAVLVARPGEIGTLRWPLSLLAALASIMALQLLPLPPSVWTALPGRGLYADIAKEAAIPLTYRPLTLSPSRTLNALFSLSVPVAAVLIFAVQDKLRQRQVFTVLLVACAASALWAVGQMAGSAQGPLYTYNVTNNGYPVGLLANRNHQAFILSILILLIGHRARRPLMEGKMSVVQGVVLAAATMLVIALVLMAGSRAGLILTALALAFSVLLILRGTGVTFTRKARIIGLTLGFGALSALIAATVLLSRAEAIARFSENDALADNRFERLAIVLEMLRDHWLLGIGLGSFEGLFKRYEDIEVLTPFIYNQAHNDWLQFPIEGGVPSIAVLAAATFWLLWRGWTILRSLAGRFDATGFAALAILLLAALASAVDYPIRTPIAMFVCAIAFAILASRSPRRNLSPR